MSRPLDKLYGLTRVDGHRVSMPGVERPTRRRGLLQPVDYTGGTP